MRWGAVQGSVLGASRVRALPAQDAETGIPGWGRVPAPLQALLRGVPGTSSGWLSLEASVRIQTWTAFPAAPEPPSPRAELLGL